MELVVPVYDAARSSKEGDVPLVFETRSPNGSQEVVRDEIQVVKECDTGTNE